MFGFGVVRCRWPAAVSSGGSRWALPCTAQPSPECGVGTGESLSSSRSLLPCLLLRSRLTFANITSVLALFVALGGTSYAALRLPANSVDSREIRSGAVGPTELRTGAAGYSELRTDAVRSSDIRRDAVKDEELATSSVGSLELRNGQVALEDLATATRATLTDVASVTFRAAVGSAGGAAGGNATGVTRIGRRRVRGRARPRRERVPVRRDARRRPRRAACWRSRPRGASRPRRRAAANTVTVRTFAADATPADAPFHLLVAC